MRQLSKKINCFLFKIRNEFIKPSRSYSYLISFFFQILRIIIENIYKYKSKDEVLVWDIRNNAITFDFVWVIFYSFYKFKKPKNGFKLIIFIPRDYKYIVPKFNSYNKYLSSNDLKSRIEDLILPLAKSFNCINSIEFCNEKNKLQRLIKYASLMPRYYHPKYFYPEPLCYWKVHEILRKENVNSNNFMDIKKVPKKERDHNNFYLKEKYITITLRDYGHSPGRNSSQKDIDIAYDFSKELNCKILLVPDDINKITSYNTQNIDICELARKNLYQRLLIYKNSLVNLIQPSGPSGASTLLNNSKTIITNYGKGSIDDNNQYFKKFYNLEIGDQPYLSLGTYLMWYENYKNYSVLDLKSIMKILHKN